MIPIPQYIYNAQAQIHRRMKTQAKTAEVRCSGTKRLLTSDFSSSIRGERQFLEVFHNYTMLTTPPTFGRSRGVIDLNSSSLDGTRKN